MIVVFSGGVGGSRFLEGLIQVVPQEDIVVVGNTGDDEEFYGLHVSPDLDIVLYTLAGVVNTKQGWGFRHETFHVMQQLTKLGNDAWFRLGDNDLATHMYRTQLLQQGKTLTQVTDSLRKIFGLQIKLIPMSDQTVRTLIKTSHGIIPFQEYFVKNRSLAIVQDVIYKNAETSRPAPGILKAIEQAQMIILAPSNPLVSIGTILAIPGILEALQKTKAPVAAISPIINGLAVKGPVISMMNSMGMEASAAGIAKAYQNFLDLMIIDKQDEDLQKEITKLGIKSIVTNTIMKDKIAKKKLAQTVLSAYFFKPKF